MKSEVKHLYSARINKIGHLNGLDKCKHREGPAATDESADRECQVVPGHWPSCPPTITNVYHVLLRGLRIQREQNSHSRATELVRNHLSASNYLVTPLCIFTVLLLCHLQI